MMKWFAAALGCTTAVMLGYVVLANSSTTQSFRIFETSSAPALGQSSAGSSVGAPIQTGSVGRVAQTGLKTSVETVTGDQSAERENRVFSTRMPLFQPTVSKQAAVGTTDRAQRPQRWTFRVVSSDHGLSGGTLDATAQAGLTRKIQREIKRVGCGRVSVSGYWDQRTRAATARFVANRNASLPTNKPDVVLLSLLRNYRGSACGRSCAGYFDASGRCIASQTAKADPGIRLQSNPKIVERAGAKRIISGWAPRVTVEATRPKLVARNKDGVTTYVTAGARNPAAQPIDRRSSNGFAGSTFSEGRMALGARRPSPQTTGVASVTVEPPTYTGSGPANAYGYGVRAQERLEADRARAVREAQQRNALRAKKVSNRRTYRRKRNKLSWKQKVHFGIPEN